MKGERSPGAEFLIRLSEIGVNIHWVLTGDGPMLIKDYEEIQDHNTKAAAPEIPYDIKDLSVDAQNVYEELLRVLDAVKELDAPPEVTLSIYEGLTKAIERFEHAQKNTADPDDSDS